MRQWQISRWIRDRDAWTIIGTSDKTFVVYRNAHPIAESVSTGTKG